MARNRQRAKERQAARRAARQAEQGPQPLPPGDDIEEDVDLAVGSPPHDLGHSDAFVEELAEEDAAEDDLEAAADRELELEAEEAGALESVEETYAPRGRRGSHAHELGGEETRRERGRFIQFLIHVWAELQRVQWPDRQALTTLTGVVLGFVLIAGGYLGLLDAIFSRLIKEIL